MFPMFSITFPISWVSIMAREDLIPVKGEPVVDFYGKGVKVFLDVRKIELLES